MWFLGYILKKISYFVTSYFLYDVTELPAYRYDRETDQQFHQNPFIIEL